jgi:hypothetical protein
VVEKVYPLDRGDEEPMKKIGTFMIRKGTLSLPKTDFTAIPICFLPSFCVVELIRGIEYKI